MVFTISHCRFFNQIVTLGKVTLLLNMFSVSAQAINETFAAESETEIETSVDSNPKTYLETNLESDNWFDIDLFGFTSLSIGSVNDQRSWTNGDFGRFESGASDAESQPFNIVQLQLGLDWAVTSSLFYHLSRQARLLDGELDNVGLIENYFELYLFNEDNPNQLNIRIGQAFFASSQENTEPLWQSPYSLSLSSWNYWIAQEFRPIGINADYQHKINEYDHFLVGLGLFNGNDSMGSQLAWGGWRIGNRISVLGETIPLPPLFSLDNGDGVFADQRDDGTRPFGPDLDDRSGYHARIKWSRDESLKLQYSRVDNRGDRRLNRGEYAWQTAFDLVGFHWRINKHWELLGEIARGETGMGNVDVAVQVDFQNSYLMTSWHHQSHRISLRLEDFWINEKDFTVAENNQDDGNLLTLAWIFQAQQHWQLGTEISYFYGTREGLVASDANPETRGSQLLFQLLYRID